VNFETYSDEEIKRWLWLRAIEWSGFPGYVSQITAPILFVFYPWYQIVLGVVLIGLIWCVVRYWFLSVTLSNIACLFVVWFKWPVAIGSAIYLFFHKQPIAGLLALVWPLIAGFITPPGKVGRIELALAKRIGFVQRDAEL